MKEIYSKAEDCFELAKYLDKNLGHKIEFYGSVYLEILSGKYHCLPFDAYDSFLDYQKDNVTFNFKFCKDGFLRVSVGNNTHPQSIGHKLAVLSDFYRILYKQFGKPTVFYTTKDDPDEALSLQWSFTNKDEEVQCFKNGTYFDDAEIDKLIIIGESDEKTNCCQLNNSTLDYISNSIDIPSELIGLVNENIEDFIKYKTGKEITTSKKSILSEDTDVSSEKKLIFRKETNT